MEKLAQLSQGARSERAALLERNVKLKVRPMLYHARADRSDFWAAKREGGGGGANMHVVACRSKLTVGQPPSAELCQLTYDRNGRCHLTRMACSQYTGEKSSLLSQRSTHANCEPLPLKPARFRARTFRVVSRPHSCSPGAPTGTVPAHPCYPLRFGEQAGRQWFRSLARAPPLLAWVVASVKRVLFEMRWRPITCQLYNSSNAAIAAPPPLCLSLPFAAAALQVHPIIPSRPPSWLCNRRAVRRRWKEQSGRVFALLKYVLARACQPTACPAMAGKHPTSRNVWAALFLAGAGLDPARQRVLPLKIGFLRRRTGARPCQRWWRRRRPRPRRCASSCRGRRSAARRAPAARRCRGRRPSWRRRGRLSDRCSSLRCFALGEPLRPGSPLSPDATLALDLSLTKADVR